MSIEQFYDFLIRESIHLGASLITPVRNNDETFMSFQFENEKQVNEFIKYAESFKRNFVVFHRVVNHCIEFHAKSFRA